MGKMCVSTGCRDAYNRLLSKKQRLAIFSIFLLSKPYLIITLAMNIILMLQLSGREFREEIVSFNTLSHVPVIPLIYYIINIQKESTRTILMDYCS